MSAYVCFQLFLMEFLYLWGSSFFWFGLFEYLRLKVCDEVFFFVAIGVGPSFVHRIAGCEIVTHSGT